MNNTDDSDHLSQHRPALLHYTAGYTDPATAEDITQETLLRAWQHPPTHSQRRWLMKVARNLLTDRYRYRQNRPETLSGGDIEGGSTDPTAPLPAQLTVQAALRALAAANPGYARVIYLLWYEDLSIAAAAQRLGIAEGTVKSRHHYALRWLRNLLAAEVPDDL